ncbi:MAG: hypothetical protein FWD58_04220 [Firmicutes bacterium]|nr:hypothetical protein [Bacillota bacterium]
MPVFFYALIAILAVSLLALDIRVEIEADAKLLANEGGFRVRVFGIPVYKGEFHAESKDPAHNNLVLEHHKKKSGEIHLSADKKDKKSVASLLTSPLVAATRIKKLDLDVKLGAEHDPFFTTMAFGSARIVLYSALCFIKSRFGTQVSENFTPDYHADRLDFSAHVMVRLLVGELVWEWAKSINEKRKTKNEKRRMRVLANNE